jgi:hypothetical protein
MTTNNPQLYKFATQQLKVLRTLAKMSIAIDDKEGLEIIHAAEVAIERRIQITRMDDYSGCRELAAQLLGYCQ